MLFVWLLATQRGARALSRKAVQVLGCMCGAADTACAAGVVAAGALPPLLALLAVRPPGQDTVCALRGLQQLARRAGATGAQARSAFCDCGGMRCLNTLLGKKWLHSRFASLATPAAHNDAYMAQLCGYRGYSTIIAHLAHFPVMCTGCIHRNMDLL